MNEQERLLRDAFLSECWPTVREYHDGDPLPRRATKRRAANGDRPVDKARKGAA